jgi:hypothetical protein
VLDIVGGITQRRASAPDILPAAAAAITAASSSTAPSTLTAVAPVVAAVAGPVASYFFSRLDRDRELAHVERQQKREMAQRSVENLVVPHLHGLASTEPDTELCEEDAEGVAKCEAVKIVKSVDGRIHARRRDGSLYMKCERLPNGAVVCMRGNRRLSQVKER